MGPTREGPQTGRLRASGPLHRRTRPYYRPRLGRRETRTRGDPGEGQRDLGPPQTPGGTGRGRGRRQEGGVSREAEEDVGRGAGENQGGTARRPRSGEVCKGRAAVERDELGGSPGGGIGAWR